MVTDAEVMNGYEAMSASMTLDAEWMNRECACLGLDADSLATALDTELGMPGLGKLVADRCPHVFSALPVFVSQRQADQMSELVAAVESVVALPGYREMALDGAPPIVRHAAGGARGVFFGYDFHVGPAGVALIEINTNAGGAMLNAALARSQRACCPSVERLLPQLACPADFDREILDMFAREWAAVRGPARWRSIAIVDDAPQSQYLYPEFLMFRRLFERAGLEAVIADPAELRFDDGVLWHGKTAIDLVYNRLTDFRLEQSANTALRDAYLAGAVVLTPHPQAHALYADKRNLVLLSDEDRLRALEVPAPVRRALLDAIPRTELVSPLNADRLWNERRGLFFKPVAGYGGRAAYRGDKLTHRVWREIVAGEYVAQAVVMPGVRTGGGESMLKYDIRNYVYDGRVQSMAARLYSGQTTNFRTPGGGFAPVYRWPE